LKISQGAERILLIVFVLVGLGIVMTYSASGIYAERYFHDATYFLKKQLLFAAVGFIALLVCMRISPDWIREHSRGLVLFSLFLLLLVFIPGIGKSGGGARRWIRFFNFSIQPVEFAKIALCAYLCDYLVRKGKKISEGGLKVFFPPLLVVGITCLLVIVQPDLGSVIFILITALFLFFLAGLKFRYIFSAMLFGVPLVILMVVIEPYRLKRIVAYLDPWQDPRGSGYQIIQSFLAFGLGGLKGVGLGASTQKLFYLPQSYTDFIYSIIGEELGFLGTVFVIALFIFILLQGQWIAKNLRDPFRSLFAYALTTLICLQAALNLMVTTGIIPTKGLPLPFISYGGSSLVFNLAAVGLLVGLDSYRGKHR